MGLHCISSISTPRGLPEETQRDFNEVKQKFSMVLADFLSNEESIPHREETSIAVPEYGRPPFALARSEV